MKKFSQGPGVGVNPGYVTASRERAQQRSIGVLIELELLSQGSNVEQAIFIKTDLHDLCQALPPWEQIGVVLVRPNKNYPSFFLPQSRQYFLPQNGRDRDSHYFLQPFDCCGGSRATEQQYVVIFTTHTPLYILRCLMHHFCCPVSHKTITCMCVSCSDMHISFQRRQNQWIYIYIYITLKPSY